MKSAASRDGLERRKNARRRDSEAVYRLAAIANSSQDAIIGKNLQGVITSWNKAAEDLYGYKMTSVLGKPVSEVFSNEHWSGIKAAADLAKKQTSIQQYETVLYKDNGQKIDLSITVSPVRDTGGKLLGTSIIARDITALRTLERRKDAFISIASHELKTPMTSIKAFSQLLDRRFKNLSDDKAVYYLSKIESQIDKLTNFIDTLLDLSRIERGKFELKREVFVFEDLVSETVEDLQASVTTHRIIRKGVVKSLVRADQYRVGQVLSNLLENAIKYSPKADRVILSCLREKDCVRVSIQDFGQGIPKEKQEKVFQRYYSIERKFGASPSGLGLGLYISREIINQHHGRLWVESDGSTGSTFYFILPN